MNKTFLVSAAGLFAVLPVVTFAQVSPMQSQGMPMQPIQSMQQPMGQQPMGMGQQPMGNGFGAGRPVNIIFNQGNPGGGNGMPCPFFRDSNNGFGNFANQQDGMPRFGNERDANDSYNDPRINDPRSNDSRTWHGNHDQRDMNNPFEIGRDTLPLPQDCADNGFFNGSRFQNGGDRRRSSRGESNNRMTPRFGNDQSFLNDSNNLDNGNNSDNSNPSDSNLNDNNTPSQDGFASQVENEILTLTNQVRQQNGLAPVSDDNQLDTVAYDHSADMLSNNYFDHTDQNGCDPACRLQHANYSFQSMGENIYWASGYTQDPTQIAQRMMQDWMQSPAHRANILNASYNKAGIGVSANGSKIEATVDFALSR